MVTINVEPTAQTIEAMVESMRDCANELASIAQQMRAKGDIDLASEAVARVASLVPNLRMDLLVQRPVRALRNLSNDDPSK